MQIMLRALRLGLLGLTVAACQPQATDDPSAERIALACQGFEDQEACQQVIQSCLDSDGEFESIALVNSADNQPMFNIVCRGPDAGPDPVPVPETNDNDTPTTATTE